MASLIRDPVTQNYIYQSMITTLCSHKDILANGIHPKTDLFLQYMNHNFETLKKNGYKYNFVYNFLMSDFINSDVENIKHTEVISHDQMSLNFGADLYPGKTATIGSLFDSSNSRSEQFPNGITLKDYMESIIRILPPIVNACPVNIGEIQEYYPQSYIHKYEYLDLMGNMTTKTASFTAIKYTHKGIQKVILFGTGLQEFVHGRQTGGSTRRRRSRR